MALLRFLYPIISRVAAIVLLVAGCLKAQELLTGPMLEPPPWGVILLTGFELFFGAWLLIGLYPRWSRLAALICFIGFLNVALIRALEGLPSCGCFGQVPVRPWVAVVLDGLMIIAMLLVSPTRDPGARLQVMRLRVAFVALCGLGVLALFGWRGGITVGFWPKRIPSTPDAELTAGIDPAILERILQGLERNHAALNIYVSTTEDTSIEYPIESKWGPTLLKPEGDDGKQKPKERTQRITYKTMARGDELKRHCTTNVEGLDARETLVGVAGRRIQYVPGRKQAWIQGAAVPDLGRGVAADLRCAGFAPPVRSIADWLRKAEVKGSGVFQGDSGENLVRLRVLAPPRSGKRPDDVTIDFVPSMNYMPSQVVYRYYPAGWIDTVNKIEYTKVDSAQAWFPRAVTSRCFIFETTSDPEATTGCNIFQVANVKVLSVGGGVQDEDFDPIIPPDTRLVGNLAAARWTGKESVRASMVTRKTTLELTQKPGNAERIGSGSSPLYLVFGIDFALIGFGVAFRRRLAL